MDTSNFEDLTRTLAGSRRILLSGGLAVVASWLGINSADTKKKRKRKKRKPKTVEPKPKPNEYGCFEVGDPCASADDCCSSVCESGKCRAHGTGTCEQGELHFCTAGNPLSTVCNGAECLCLRTTAGSNYCGSLPAPTVCTDCQKDADCEAQGLPPGTACVPMTGELACKDQCASDMACVVPCGTPLPESLLFGDSSS